MTDVIALVLTAALVGVTAVYAALTKRIADASQRSAQAAAETAESSERSARTGVEAAEAAARSAAAAEAALLAESMPFVRPSFGGGSRTAYKMFVKNSGRHAALNVQLSIGNDPIHTFPVVEPDASEYYTSEDTMAERLMTAPHASPGWVLRTRYSDPYGNRYEVEEKHSAPGGVTPEHRVSSYRLAPDGTRIPLLSPRGEGNT